MKQIKIGVVYTSTTPELIQMVEEEIRKQIGESVTLFSQQDPSILAEIRENGFVTAQPAARLITMYMNAVREKCDVVYNTCSSVGETADCMQTAAAYLGVPIVRIDEEMCREAVRKGNRIGVMATLRTTLEPTMNTIRRISRECGKSVELTECLVEGAFGLNQEEFRQKMEEYAVQIAPQTDVILFAQGSMAYCEQEIAVRTGRMVLSSPRFGAQELKRVLIKNGMLD